MDLQEAAAEIRNILDQIPDHLLPQPTNEESSTSPEYGTCYWFGGRGYYVGSCINGAGESIPSDFRASALQAMFEQELMQRLENEHWAAKAVEA